MLPHLQILSHSIRECRSIVQGSKRDTWPRGDARAFVNRAADMFLEDIIRLKQKWEDVRDTMDKEVRKFGKEESTYT